MKIALAQINTIAGNVPHNTGRIVEEIAAAAAAGARLVIFEEMAVTGYPPKDLLEYASFVAEAAGALPRIREACAKHRIDCLLGTIHPNTFGGKKELLNAAAFLSADGQIRYAFKKLLPTYDVFDEHRYFQPCPASTPPLVIEYDDEGGRPLRLGISICEDIWNDSEFDKGMRHYECDPIEAIVRAGANAVVNLSSSPYVLGKPKRRVEMFAHIAARWNVPVIVVNQVGGCDQIVFDGGSQVAMPDGAVPCCAGWFNENTVTWDTADTQTCSGFDAMLAHAGDDTASLHDALVLGLRDYLRKTGFAQAIVGNSGGIDSAVVLSTAVSALGAGCVMSVSMPGPFTSAETRADSATLARNLGVRHMELPIGDVVEAYGRVLASPSSAAVQTLFGGDPAKIGRLPGENVQARIRGNYLMWLSNALTSPPTLVLSTGNKSELAAGYCTLYGDMAGGLALISDVPKMMVYRLAGYLNRQMGGPIPESIIARAPTAELAPNQKDSDTLPPYPVLDEIVRLYVEECRGADDIVAAGVADEAVVRRTIRMIDRAEYKRQQAAPGLKVTCKAFGAGRRMPIARG